MITLNNQTQQGFFAYEGTDANAEGNYTADVDGNLTNVYMTFKVDGNNIGNASIFLANEQPQYNINVSNLIEMTAIASEIETLLNELKECIKKY